MKQKKCFDEFCRVQTTLYKIIFQDGTLVSHQHQPQQITEDNILLNHLSSIHCYH